MRNVILKYTYVCVCNNNDPLISIRSFVYSSFYRPFVLHRYQRGGVYATLDVTRHAFTYTLRNCASLYI